MSRAEAEDAVAAVWGLNRMDDHDGTDRVRAELVAVVLAAVAAEREACAAVADRMHETSIGDAIRARGTV